MRLWTNWGVPYLVTLSDYGIVRHSALPSCTRVCGDELCPTAPAGDQMVRKGPAHRSNKSMKCRRVADKVGSQRGYTTSKGAPRVAQSCQSWGAPENFPGSRPWGTLLGGDFFKNPSQHLSIEAVGGHPEACKECQVSKLRKLFNESWRPTGGFGLIFVASCDQKSGTLPRTCPRQTRPALALCGINLNTS